MDHRASLLKDQDRLFSSLWPTDLQRMRPILQPTRSVWRSGFDMPTQGAEFRPYPQLISLNLPYSPARRVVRSLQILHHWLHIDFDVAQLAGF